MSNTHDARCISVLRDDISLYKNLYKDTFHAACAQLARMQVLERQNKELQQELRRYTSQRCA